jgi:hypothetical protein
MQTNFFRQLANMNLTGDLQIIRPTTENSFVFPYCSITSNADEARKLIPPLNLREQQKN